MLQKFVAGVICFLCLINLSAIAQQHRFIYIQSNDEQPFYIVLKGKVYSSSETGYLIVPKLTDGKYSFTLGFPLNKYPEQIFNCTVDNKDAGYELKKFDDKNWALVDFQTQDILMAGAETAVAARNPAFGDMLSQVVDDSALTQRNTIVTDETNNNNNEVVINKGDNELKDTQEKTVQNENVNDDVQENPGGTMQPVKTFEQSGIEGTDIVFLDNSGAGSDTVRIFIPSANSKAENLNTTAKNNPTVPADNLAGDKNESDKNALPAINDELSQTDTNTNEKDIQNPFYKAEENTEKNNTRDNIVTDNNGDLVKTNETTVKSSAIREDCSKVLSDDELDKMKRKMFSQKNDEKMIEAANKFISGKCLNTEQVRTLSVLFLTDEGRYNLFDSMYKYVLDYGRYNTLESQIIDPYYKKRFQALLPN